MRKQRLTGSCVGRPVEQKHCLFWLVFETKPTVFSRLHLDVERWMIHAWKRSLGRTWRREQLQKQWAGGVHRSRYYAMSNSPIAYFHASATAHRFHFVQCVKTGEGFIKILPRLWLKMFLKLKVDQTTRLQPAPETTRLHNMQVTEEVIYDMGRICYFVDDSISTATG